jgi:methyltransferase (TIGR00027 family)
MRLNLVYSCSGRLPDRLPIRFRCNYCRFVQAERQSQTAFGVAFARAVEASEPEGVRILEDPYAIEFVRDAAGGPFASRPMFAFARYVIGVVMPGMIEFVAIRGRYSDEVVTREARAGAEQYVILGAGFDTAALRLRAALPELEIFEVDHPATQAVKLKTLARIDPEGRARVRFVPVDFERDDLVSRLEEAGFDAGRRSVVTWMGVSYYLTEEAIAATLDRLARLLAPGSALAFDYVPPSVVDGTARHRAARIGTWRAARSGEPFLFGIELPELDALLARHGFVRVEHLTPDEMVARYATPRRRMIDFAYLVTARREDSRR